MSKFMLSMALGLVALVGLSRGVQAQSIGDGNSETPLLGVGGNGQSHSAPVQPRGQEPQHPLTQPPPAPSIQPFSGANHNPDYTPPTPVERSYPEGWEYPSPQPAMYPQPSHTGGIDSERFEHVWEVWLLPRGERYRCVDADDAEEKGEALAAQLPGLRYEVKDLGPGQGAYLILHGNPILFRSNLHSKEEAVRVVERLKTRLPYTKAVIEHHETNLPIEDDD